MLLGEANLNKVVSTEKDFGNKIDSYEPAEQAIEFLRNYDKEILIEVVYGSWCPDSIRNVPRFIKVIQEANNTNIQTRFIGVDRNKREPATLLWGKDIQRVPTFIVYSGNEELGRIVENPLLSIEEDLVEILKRKEN
jgi:thiol-disulfide isomerase/thioredoxin